VDEDPDPRLDFDDSALLGVDAVSPTDVWAVGSDPSEDTLTFHWNGVAWSRVESPNPSRRWSQLWDVAVLSSDKAWAVGRGAGGIPVLLYWNGMQWSERAVPGEGKRWLYDIDITPHGEAFATGWRFSWEAMALERCPASA
jgi:hypothetical protein